jgi:hypothetical protein
MTPQEAAEIADVWGKLQTLTDPDWDEDRAADAVRLILSINGYPKTVTALFDLLRATRRLVKEPKPRPRAHWWQVFCP